jgi:hypothetical protein
MLKDSAMIIKKTNAQSLPPQGTSNDHAFNTDSDPGLHGTIFLGWHKEEWVVPY